MLISVQRDGSDGAVHEIREDGFDIGRSSGQLRFPEDLYLSERHCRLQHESGGWVLKDLDSFNGIYRRFVEPREVNNGVSLLLGKQVLRFERLDDEELALGPCFERGVMLFGAPLRTPWGRLSQMTVAGIARDVYHLHRTQVTVGREDGDITFPEDEFMSRKHMAISHIDGKVVVQDLGSSNGTFVRVRGQTDLFPGDLIRIGDQLLRFETV